MDHNIISYAILNPRDLGCEYISLTQEVMNGDSKIFIALMTCFAALEVDLTPEIKITQPY